MLEHEEEYVFTLPSAYARSILTIPWVELGGKVNINCARTGYSATVTFHTKPFYGGKVHRYGSCCWPGFQGKTCLVISLVPLLHCVVGRYLDFFPC